MSSYKGLVVSYDEILKMWGYDEPRFICHVAGVTVGTKYLSTNLLIWQPFVAQILPVLMFLKKQRKSEHTHYKNNNS